MRIKIIGAGLAGCEAAWQCARRGVEVELYEMRPVKSTPAHQTGNFAELVCSSSLISASWNTRVQQSCRSGAPVWISPDAFRKAPPPGSASRTAPLLHTQQVPHR